MARTSANGRLIVPTSRLTDDGRQATVLLTSRSKLAQSWHVYFPYLGTDKESVNCEGGLKKEK
jgi:hypothetical protein